MPKRRSKQPLHLDSNDAPSDSPKKARGLSKNTKLNKTRDVVQENNGNQDGDMANIGIASPAEAFAHLIHPMKVTISLLQEKGLSSRITPLTLKGWGRL